MKVGLVCPYSWDVPGGVRSHVADLAVALGDHGHEVSVLAPVDDPADLPSWVADGGRPIAVRYNGSVARLSFGVKATRRVRGWIRDGDFDVLHVHEPVAPEPVDPRAVGRPRAHRGDLALVARPVPHHVGRLLRGPDRDGEGARPHRRERGRPAHAGDAPGRRRRPHPERRAGVRVRVDASDCPRSIPTGPAHPLPRPDGRAAQGARRPRRGAARGAGRGTGPAGPHRRARRHRRAARAAAARRRSAT